MSPPAADAVLEGLTRIARETVPLAVVWHALLGAALLALGFGYRPRRRLAGMVLSVPIASAGVVAWRYANPFNAALLGAGALALAAAACLLPTSRVHAATATARVAALCLVGFAWVYPHFLPDGAGLAFLYAAPLGALPCPTLAAVVGLSHLAQGFESRLWSSVLGGLGLFYGIVGTMWLGVTIDLFLTLGALLLLARAWWRSAPLEAKIPST
jgi:hypothetical protein